MTTFTVHYTPEQQQDEQLGPDAIVATASDSHGLTIIWRPGSLEDGFEFEVTEPADPGEVEHLMKRLVRHGLRVVDGDGNEQTAT